eukprot:759019-Pleurochrysis_carterae.AAC.1
MSAAAKRLSPTRSLFNGRVAPWAAAASACARCKKQVRTKMDSVPLFHAPLELSAQLLTTVKLTAAG